MGEIFGQEGLKLFKQQNTTTTSYIDESFREAIEEISE